MTRRVVSKLLASLMIASLLLTGCGTEETVGKTEKSQVEEEEKTEKETGDDAKDSILIEDISWSWSVSDYEVYQMLHSPDGVNLDLFEGIVDYSDGTQGTVKPDRVLLAEKTKSLRMRFVMMRKKLMRSI